MGSSEWSLVWVGIVSLIVSIYAIYSNSKQRAMDKVDAQQADFIKDLYKKNETLGNDLSAFKEKVANEHYKSAEVDRIVDRLDKTCADGFRDLGGKFDRMVELLTTRLLNERKTERN